MALALSENNDISSQLRAGNGPSAAESCFHCGLPVPDGLELTVSIDDVDQPMCCHGCEAVARAIIDAGGVQFYRFRDQNSETGQVLVPDFLRQTELYDLPEMQHEFVRIVEGQHKEASLMLEGVTCAACIWLIEKTLEAMDGISEVRLNYATQRAWLSWDNNRVQLSQILQKIAAIGYRALPYNPAQQQLQNQNQRRAQQRRLAVSGLFGMQVMMISVSLYMGAWTGMEAGFEHFFRYLSLALSLPVVLYAAIPFYQSAWRDLTHRSISMDVPVTLAILIAFASSLIATFDGQGHVYFDSVVMFVFFLTASRYFEMAARQKCSALVEKLVQGIPLLARRVSLTDGQHETISASLLEPGDRVLVTPGEPIPADGCIVSGYSSTDESLLNGESLPQSRGPGDRVLGGSINLANPIQMDITAAGADTLLAEIHRMIERAQADKPALARLADRVASRFIVLVLLAVVATALTWWLMGSELWFEIALSVLIVSCPCALSLAIPTALSVTLGKMQSTGMLVKKARTLDVLNRITHVVFDKTGTLTLGKPALTRHRTDPGFDADICLQLAISLESHSEHPLAGALLRSAGNVRAREATDLVNMPGAGICGKINGQDYYIGSPDYIESATGRKLTGEWRQMIGDAAETAVVLSNAQKPLASYHFSDPIRVDATSLIQSLKQQGCHVSLMTGDAAAAATQIAALADIEDWRASMSPAMKKEAVKSLQDKGGVVLMIGDGINDAPVLASADLSIAMGTASALAKSSADILLLSNRLSDVTAAFRQARKTRSVVRQNLIWALGYNFSAIPAAAIGLIAPWMAAIGMSISSLVVVLNAMRLSRK